MDSGIAEKIKEGAKFLGDMVGGLLKWMVDNPWKSLLGGILFGAAKWIANGFALAKGFKLGTQGFGGGGGGGIGDMLGGKGGKMGFGSRLAKGASGLVGGKNTMAGRGLRNMAASGGPFGKAMPGLGMGLGIGGAALDVGRGMMDDPDSGSGKAMGVGSAALTGAGMGAMLGPIGAAVGALVGGIYGAVQEFGGTQGGKEKGTARLSTLAGDVMSPAKGVTQISTKEGGLFNLSGRDDVVAAPGAVKALKNSSGGGTTNIHISFDEIKVTSDGSVGRIDLEKDTAFITQLATKIKESLSKTANGGVLSPNPSS